MLARKIYIDAGAHCGDTVEGFLKGEVLGGRDDYKEFEIFAFDPVAYTADWARIKADYLDVKIEFIQKAISTADGVKDFAVCDDTYASTLTKDCIKYPVGRIESVECVDLSNWIRSNFSKDDFIVLKLDIEGGEFDVLEHMAQTDTFSLINVLIVEWHNFLLPDDYYERKENLLKRISVDIQEWH